MDKKIRAQRHRLFMGIEQSLASNFRKDRKVRSGFVTGVDPHNTKYDAASANRFGIERPSRLLSAPVKAGFNEKPVVEIKGSTISYISLLKSDKEGKLVQVRLVLFQIKMN